MVNMRLFCVQYLARGGELARPYLDRGLKDRSPAVRAMAAVSRFFLSPPSPQALNIIKRIIISGREKNKIIVYGRLAQMGKGAQFLLPQLLKATGNRNSYAGQGKNGVKQNMTEMSNLAGKRGCQFIG